MVAGVSNLTAFSPSNSFPSRADNGLVFLDNGTVRVGVDRHKGGAVTWLSWSDYPGNAVNHHDPGRLIQQSYYAGKALDRTAEGQSEAWSPWTWNPIQGGGVGSWARVTELKQSKGQSLYTESIPKLWDMPDEEAEARMRQWTGFEPSMPDVVVVRCEFASHREDDDRWGGAVRRAQEVPACYFTRNFDTPKSYLGDGKWRLESQPPGPPWGKANPPRKAMALFNAEGQGIAIFSPAATLPWNFGPHGAGTSDDPQAGPCMHVAPIDRVEMAPRSIYRYRYWIAVGTAEQLAASLDRLWQKYAGERAEHVEAVPVPGTREDTQARLAPNGMDTGLAVPPAHYVDGRPQTHLRLEAKDQGVVLKHGDGPGDCDLRGSREAIVFEDKGVYYLHYDGAGSNGWLACLPTSRDLVHWEKQGPVLEFGKPGSPDAAGACSPWVISDGNWWHMFYLGTPNATPAPDYIPAFPYLTLKARSRSPSGLWEKQYEVAPFTPQPGTYYSSTASPGHIVNWQGEFLMFFSASTSPPDVKRTLGLARARNLDGPWVVQSDPLLPLAEQVENSSLYYEPEIDTWFLFTNHIGINDHNQEFTDAVWVYWSQDPNQWDAGNKAVVLDGRNCSWSKNCIGMPSVIKVGRRLALFYDAPGGDSINHMQRDIGLAWLDLPLRIPVPTNL